MFFWVYDLPSWQFCLLIVVVCVVFGVGGLWLSRPLARRLVGPPPGINDIAGNIIQAAGAFYGITLGLIAVGAWQTSGDTDTRVTREAASLAALYRDVSAFSEPHKGDCQALLKEYTSFTIDKAWPAQRHGEILSGGTEIMTRLEKVLTSFEPTSELQKILVGEAFSEFNRLTEARQMRIQSTTSGMPSTIWWVVFAGGAATMMMCWLMVFERKVAVYTVVGLLAILIGLIIFLTAEMDHPYRGEFGVGPDAIVEVRDQLMK